MKILVLTKSISRNTGGSSTILDASETLYTLGYDVYLGLIASSPISYVLFNKKHSKTIIPFKNIYAVPKSLTKYLYKWKKGRKRGFFIDNIVKPFFIILNDSTRLFQKRKFIKILHEVDVIITAVPFYTGAMEAIKSYSKAKIILNHAGSVHSYEKFWLTKSHQPKTPQKNLSLYVNYCNQFDYILFQADDQAKECKQQSPLLANSPIVVKPSCEEKKVIAAKKSNSPYKSDTFNIVNIGSIQPRKAQDLSVEVLLKLINEYPNIHMHFVGVVHDTDFLKRLKTEIEKHNLNNVHFYGHRYDYLRFLAHADILLQTSKAEGVSRVIREAMLIKTLVVSFKIPGISSTLENNKEAILIEPFDIVKLTNSIKELYNNRKLKESLTNSAFNRYLLDHSWVSYANSWETILNNL